MLIDFDGFDNYAAPEDLMQVQGDFQWNLVQSPVVGNPISFAAGRGGASSGQCIVLPSGGSGLTKVPAKLGGGINQNATGAIFYGMAMRQDPEGVGFSAYAVFEIWDYVANEMQCSVRFNWGGGVVAAYRGSTLLGYSAGAAFTSAGWTFIEVKTIIHASAGEITVRCSGNTVLSLTGINTQTSANAFQNGFLFSSDAFLTASFTTRKILNIDDFYVADDTAGGPIATDTFIGDCRSVQLTPVSNDAVMWNPLSGANWEMVDEAVFDGDTTYNYTAVDADQDTFAHAALTGTIVSIVATKVVTAARIDGAGTYSLEQVLQSAATDYYSTPTGQLTSVYQFQRGLWLADPATGFAWTMTSVNAAKIGYRLQV